MKPSWRPSWEQAGIAFLAGVYLLALLCVLIATLLDPNRRLP
jgi:hypothetical protein